MNSPEPTAEAEQPRQTDEVPAWLEIFVPAAFLLATLVYIADIYDIARPEKNLLMLSPLLAVVLGLLALISWAFILPLFARDGRAASHPGAHPLLRERFGDRSVLLMLLLAVYAVAAFATSYVAATIVFICITAWLMGMRHKLGIALMAVLTSLVLFFSATEILNVRM